MTPITRLKRKRRYLLIIVLAPSLLAILASLWPFEATSIALTCIVLAIITVFALSFVQSRSGFLAGITTLAILLSVATLHWPLRAAYFLSRPSFDQVATQVRAGNPPKQAQWIGLFHIRKAEIYHNGIVCLWTDDDPAGPTGFVQYSSEQLPFNLWSHIPLDHSWQFISED